MEKLIPTPGKATLSDVQETFQKYLQRIEELRQDLQNYEAWEAMARERVKQEILPLEEAVVDAHVRRVHLFNDAYHSKAFKKAEKGALQEFILQEAAVLIRRFGREELRTIYNEHMGQETKTEKDRLEELKELFTQQYGIHFEGVRLTTEQELRAYVAEQMAKQQARQEEKRQKRAQKKEKRKQQKAAQTPDVVPTELIPLRKLYMNLVKLLHPDRERDEDQRQHKTRLMQELTEAYQQGNWFALMKLQSEQPEASQAGNFQEMAAYNQALKKQADQLQSQLNEVRKSEFQARFVAEPRQMDAKFAQEIRRLKATIQQLQEELKRSRNPEHLKDLIRSYV